MSHPSPTAQEKSVLRELAKQTMEIAAQDIQNTRREMWADFNSLRKHHVPVYVLDPQGCWREVFSQDDLECKHPLFRQYENWLRLQLYHASFGDDFVTEPWVTVSPVYKHEKPHWGSWGIPLEYERINDTLAMHYPDPPIKNPEDLAKLVKPIPTIDETETREKTDMLQDAIGDIIAVIPDNMPHHTCGMAGSHGYLLGPEEMFYQFCDQPDMVHALCKFMADANHQICDMAEQNGWFANNDQTFLRNALIQAMAYNHEIASPSPQRQVIPMNQHWIYDAAQEYEAVSPEMFNEFLIEYQKPIYERFGLTAYGCCENLTHKLPYLKRVKNLRRVAVTPWADPESCAQQLEDKYVISYRPPPMEMVGPGWDPAWVREHIKNVKAVFDRYNCFWEVNLKDFITVDHDKDRLQQWVQVVRAALED